MPAGANISLSSAVLSPAIGFVVSYVSRYYFNISLCKNTSLIRHSRIYKEYGDYAKRQTMIGQGRIMDGVIFAPCASAISLILLFVIFCHILIYQPATIRNNLQSANGTLWVITTPFLNIGLSFVFGGVLAGAGMFFGIRFLQSKRAHDNEVSKIYRRVLNAYAAFLLSVSIYLVLTLEII
jgi:hypothetical protein